MLYNYLWFFFLYAFCGWCVEVAFHAVSCGKFINRGFLNGPVCPIYGVGMVLVIGLLTPIADNVLLLFAGAVLLTSVIEGLTGFILEKAFRQRWWDYSNMPCNLNGYICLKFSLLWGLACLLIMDIVHPALVALIGLLPPMLGRVFLACLSAVLLTDIIASVSTVRKLNRQLAHIDEIAANIRRVSDQIGQGLSAATLEGMEKLSEYKEDLADLKEYQEELIADFKEDLLDYKEGRAEYLAERKERQAKQLAEWRTELARLREQQQKAVTTYHFGSKRLLKAFPDLRSLPHNEALEQLRRYLKRDKR